VLAGSKPPRVAKAQGVEPVLGAVSSRADALVFGPGEPPEEDVRAFWADVDGAREEVRAAVPWTRRLRATVSLRSLRAARTAARAERAASADGQAGTGERTAKGGRGRRAG